MKIIQLNIFKGEVNEKLFPLLNGKIFHITSAINSNLILDSGKISGDTKLEKTHGVFSNDSYGRNRGYICLCDLRNWDSLSEEKKGLGTYFFLFFESRTYATTSLFHTQFKNAYINYSME